jgi:hypothetical protein
MLGLLADFAGNALGDFLIEILFEGLGRPFRRQRSRAKCNFGLI